MLVGGLGRRGEAEETAEGGWITSGVRFQEGGR